MNLTLRNRPKTVKIADKATGVYEGVLLNTVACSTQQSPSRSSGIRCSHKRGNNDH